MSHEHEEKKIVIIGAGPTGLGAAYRLKELGYKNFHMYDRLGHLGGLASSYTDSAGFTWDTSPTALACARMSIRPSCRWPRSGRSRRPS